MVLVGELIPKTLGVGFANQLVVPVVYTVQAMVFMLRPMLWVTSRLARLFLPGVKRPVTSSEELRLLASLGKSEGAVGSQLAEMVEGATSLKELTAYDIMVPRHSVAMLSAERTLEENLGVIRRTGHSRFPFTLDGELDHLKGIVLVKDLMFQLHERQGQVAWDALVAKAMYVPATHHSRAAAADLQGRTPPHGDGCGRIRRGAGHRNPWRTCSRKSWGK